MLSTHHLCKSFGFLIGFALIADLGLASWYYGLVRGRQDHLRTAHAHHVVVLFNDFDSTGGPDAETRRRLRHAVDLVRHSSGLIVCAGGARPHTGRFGSELMRERMIAEGFDPERILLETMSNSTRSNLRSAAAVLQRQGIQTATIVSSPVHLVRVEHLASNLTAAITFGFSAYDPEHADPPVSRLAMFWQIQHELAAWAVEFLVPEVWQSAMIDRMRAHACATRRGHLLSHEA